MFSRNVPLPGVQKATINSKNNDEKCFQYAVTVALNYQKINNHPEEIYVTLLLISMIGMK